MPYPTYEERVAFGQLPQEERNELFEKMTPEERSNISGYGTEDEPGFCDMNGYCYSHEDDAEIADSYIKENRKLKAENMELSKKSNAKSDIIRNMFDRLIKDANIDDGFYIGRDWGHKYIDVWNEIVSQEIQEAIKDITEDELYEIHTDGYQFDLHIKEESDSEDEES